MALNDRLADSTVLAMIALIRDMDVTLTDSPVIYGSALYGDGDTRTIRDEVRHLMEASSSIDVSAKPETDWRKHG